MNMLGSTDNNNCSSSSSPSQSISIMDPMSTLSQQEQDQLGAMSFVLGLPSTSPMLMNQSSLPFPWKLHEMLDSAGRHGWESIVSWLPEENGFRVYDVDKFVGLVLPRFFKQSKYKSFQRQLNMWGFERILSGPQKGGYVHESFIRGKSGLCRLMRREKIKKNSTKHGTNKGGVNKSQHQELKKGVSSSSVAVAVAAEAKTSPPSSIEQAMPLLTQSFHPITRLDHDVGTGTKLNNAPPTISTCAPSLVSITPVNQEQHTNLKSHFGGGSPSAVGTGGGGCDPLFLDLCEWYEQEEQRDAAPLAATAAGRRFSLGFLVPSYNQQDVWIPEDLVIHP